MSAPYYWMDETSGVMCVAVIDYMQGRELTLGQIGIWQAYLRQWMAAHGWMGPEISALRLAIDEISSLQQLNTWLDRALDAGIEPL